MAIRNKTRTLDKLVFNEGDNAASQAQKLNRTQANVQKLISDVERSNRSSFDALVTRVNNFEDDIYEEVADVSSSLVITIQDLTASTDSRFADLSPVFASLQAHTASTDINFADQSTFNNSILAFTASTDIKFVDLSTFNNLVSAQTASLQSQIDTQGINLSSVNNSFLAFTASTDVKFSDLSTFNNAVSAQTASLQSQITSNDGDISTNAGNISTNTTNISTNTGNISTNSTNISTLQGYDANSSQAASTVIGRTYDGGSGIPIALTGLEVGEFIRFGSPVVLSSTTTYDSYSLDEGINAIAFQNATVTLRGIAAPAVDGKILHIRHAGTGRTVIEHRTAATSNDQIDLPGSNDIVLRDKDKVHLRYENGKWNLYSIAIKNYIEELLMSVTPAGGSGAGGEYIEADFTSAGFDPVLYQAIIFLVSGGGEVEIAGIDRVDGKVLYFQVEDGLASTESVTFLHQSGEASTNNQFTCPGNTDFRLTRPSAGFIVPSFRERWRTLSGGDTLRAQVNGSSVSGQPFGGIDAQPSTTITPSAQSADVGYWGIQWAINDASVSNAKLGDMGTATIKGQYLTASSGDPVDLTGKEAGEIVRNYTNSWLHDDFKSAYLDTINGFCFSKETWKLFGTSISAQWDDTPTADDAEHPGNIRLTTTTISTNNAGICQGSGPTSDVFRVDKFKSATFIVRFLTTAVNTVLQCGIAEDLSDVATPSQSYALLRYAASTGSTFHFYTDSGTGTPQDTNTGITATANQYYVITITRTNNETWTCHIDGALEATHSTTVPTETNMVNVGAVVETQTTTTRSMNVDLINVELVEFVDRT